MRKPLILLMMLVIIVLFPGILVGQASIEKVLLEDRTIQDPLKSWSVTFTQPVNKGTIKKQNFYIIDERKRELKTKLRVSEDESKVTITPESPYKDNVQYYLHIKGNVKSGKTFLNEHTILPFKLETRTSSNKGTNKTSGTDKKQVSANTGKSETNTSKSETSSSSKPNQKNKAKNLTSVQTECHSHFVEITVNVSDQVAKVKTGSDEFEYKGNNLFVLYKPDLKKGEKLTVKGYSISNKVLETKEIVIP
ncbi:Ig-like domain-containing protein [Bacillus sp. FJAT-49705]|uniref:Ig-like domain-containing protein n=1 Tax=Cytobacillus citreus TaxID=2833586 RepID=A0ABS5NSQ2_9BACI|nr:Ig-like domain-containing protein [Cytobacillus citreus]MBS4190158.1 Ig-like domain-containing protein [Cytobacillus citreus]